jgi:hypothetical protein
MQLLMGTQIPTPNTKQGQTMMKTSLQIVEHSGSEDFKTILVALLTKHQLHIVKQKCVQGGLQIGIVEGPILTIYATGTVLLQGHHQERAQAFKAELEAAFIELRHQQFVAALQRGDVC